MRNNRISKPLALFFVFFMISACHRDVSPLKITVNELEECIFSDNRHFKVLCLYNPLCGDCSKSVYELRSYINQNPSEQVAIYMVSVDCYRWKFSDSELNDFFSSEEVRIYQAKDGYSSEEYIVETMKYLVCDSLVLTGNGMSQTLIFSPQNKLLRSRMRQDGIDIIVPTELSHLNGTPVHVLDFDKYVEI